MVQPDKLGPGKTWYQESLVLPENLGPTEKTWFRQKNWVPPEKLGPGRKPRLFVKTHSSAWPIFVTNSLSLIFSFLLKILGGNRHQNIFSSKLVLSQFLCQNFSSNFSVVNFPFKFFLSENFSWKVSVNIFLSSLCKLQIRNLNKKMLRWGDVEA